MIAIDDYKNYYYGNLELINLLKNNKYVMYERFKDVIYILDFIANNYEKYKGHESAPDFEDIFEIGFSHFHSELEQVKLYFEHYLKKDQFLLKKYDALINLSLYIDDFVEGLNEKEYLTKDREKRLKKVLTEIEDIVSNKKEWDDSLFDRFNEEISACVPFKVEINTTQELLFKIAEEIMIIKG